jgi:hypothetical protein
MSDSSAFDAARRAFFLRLGAGLGCVSAAELLGAPAWARQSGSQQASARKAAPVYSHGTLTAPHVPPTARRVIYMHMLGAISQVDTFDYKPTLDRRERASDQRGARLSTNPEPVRSNPRVVSAALSIRRKPARTRATGSVSPVALPGLAMIDTQHG